MKCPVCTEVDLLLAERQGVEIDYCPKCRGVWLDRGELDKIIERQPPGWSSQPSDPGSGPRTQPAERQEQYDRRDRRDYPDRSYDRGDRYDDRRHGHQKRKRGSFLEDLFDFGD